MSDNTLWSFVRRYRPDTILLWIVALTSLALNLVLLNQVLALRQAAGQAIADAVAVIDSLQGQTFSYTAVIDNSIAVDSTIPINETIPIKISQPVPIDTTVTVPVDAGVMGTINLTVPIKAQVPIDIEQNIVINQPFRIKTSVPIQLEVPVSIRVSDTTLAGTLADLRTRLVGLAAQLGGASPTASKP